MFAYASAFLHRLFASDSLGSASSQPNAMGMYASTYLHRSDWNPR